MSTTMLGNNDRLRSFIEKNALDAVVTVSPDNFFYVTGVYLSTAFFLRRVAICVFPREGEPTLVVCDREEELTRRLAWVKDIRTYHEFRDSPIAIVIEILKEKGLAEGKIGIEMEYLAPAFYKELMELAPDATFCDCFSILQEVRAVKTPEEIELLRSSSIIIEKVHMAAYLSLKPGDTEKDLDRTIGQLLLSMGSSGYRSGMIAFGENAVGGKNVASDRRIEIGEVLWCDFGGMFSGYQAELGRTAVMGKPSPKHASNYQKLWEAEEEAIENLRVGVRASEVFAPLKKKFPNINWYGHGIGVTSHESPLLHGRLEASPYPEMALEPNMLINVEPALTDRSIPAFYHIETLVLVTEKGPKVLSNYMDRSKLFEIPV